MSENDQVDIADRRTIERLRADQDFRTAVGSFVLNAATHAARTGSDMRKAFAAGQFRMVEGVTFNVAPEVKAAESAVLRRGQEVLGSRLGDERDLSNALWRATVTALQSSDDPGERTKIVVEG